MNILVIGPSWVGDMMMSQSLYKTLKHQNPSLKIDVMAPAWCKPLLKLMPEVNQAIEMPIGHGKLAIMARYRLGKTLEKNHYDRAIILPMSFKSAFIPFFANIPVRVGWRGEFRYGLLNDIRVLDKKAFPRMIDRYLALAYPKNQMNSAKDIPDLSLNPSLHVDKQDIDITAKKLNIEQDNKYIAFCPGAEFGPAKQWPHYHYISLANDLIDAGYKIILFGSKNDHAISEKIKNNLNNSNACTNLCGITSLEEAVYLLNLCLCVVTNDSGLMHISAALNIPTVALYGPTSPDFTPPLSKKVSILRTISGYQKIKRSKLPDGYHQSLIDLKPEVVLASTLKLINDYK